MAILRVRAIVVKDGKMLCLRHTGADFLALPGGKIEK